MLTSNVFSMSEYIVVLYVTVCSLEEELLLLLLSLPAVSVGRGWVSVPEDDDETAFLASWK